MSFFAAPVRAQVSPGSSRDETAHELNRRSRELYQQGRYAEAIELLDEAYRRQPEPLLLYNKGRACEKMNDHACVIDSYERYLPNARPDERASIEAKLAHARERLLDKRASPDPSPPAVVPSGRSNSVLPSVVTSLGGIGLGMGLALNLMARSRYDDVPRDPTEAAVRNKESGDALMLGATVSAIAGGALAAAGIAWWIVDRRSSERPRVARARLHIGPGSVAVLGVF